MTRILQTDLARDALYTKVNQIADEKVSLDSDETITGDKTFNGYFIKEIRVRGLGNLRDGFYLRANDVNIITPTSVTNRLVPIEFVDVNNKSIGGVNIFYYHNEIESRLISYFPQDSNGRFIYLGITAYPDLTYETHAPKPTDTISTSSEQIATTGWVNKTGNNVVHLTDTETISGTKLFSSPIYSYRDAPIFYMKYKSTEKGTTYQSPVSCQLVFMDKNSKTFATISHAYSASKDSEIYLTATKANASTDSAKGGIVVRHSAAGEKSVTPYGDNDTFLGKASYRWKQLYAGTSTINTSDERVKQDIDNIPNDVLNAWSEVNFYQFKFKDAVAQKSSNEARLHTGVIAQRIKSVFENHNLDATKYGLLCYDEWEEREAEYNEEGEIISPARESGNLYSIRYEECLCMEAAYQRWRANKLEERIKNLEDLLTTK